jgi:hypothetical protein
LVVYHVLLLLLLPVPGVTAIASRRATLGYKSIRNARVCDRTLTQPASTPAV